MIQRIQTVLLFLAAGLMVAFLFFPTYDATAGEDKGEFHKENSLSATPTSISISRFDNEHIDWENPDSIFSEGDSKGESPAITDNIYFLLRLIVVLIAALVLLVTIFLYGNRGLQIRIAYIGILLIMVQFILQFPITTYLESLTTQGLPMMNASYKWGFGAPLAALLLTWWAVKRIQKDEKMVRGMDRIR